MVKSPEITNLTADMINNYRQLMNTPLTPADYLAFRQQAISEIISGFYSEKTKQATNNVQKTNKNSEIHPTSSAISSQSIPEMDDSSNTGNDYEDESVSQTSNFLDIIQKIED